jgi:hydroxymethylglutaryl-CoA reductase (NADPH)
MGAIGLQGNVANAIAALFIACGQDVACVSEAVTAITRFERLGNGDLYASVTLPNLIVGTVGGGTYLPTARECLTMLGCTGTGGASRFAEICAVVALAGELSIIGAMASGAFASAHASGGRKGRTASSTDTPAA